MVANLTHGMRNTPTYRSWNDMIQRCTNANNSRYAYYGERGISVCGSWLKFEGFVADMGERPIGSTLDRVNPNGNYEKVNCRWASKSIQSHNRRKLKNATSKYFGVHWSKVHKKWVSRLAFKGSVILHKTFDSEHAAAVAYDAVSLIVYGEATNSALGIMQEAKY